MFEDAYYGLNAAAKIAGLPVKQLKSLELCFFALIQFDLFVSREEYCRYKQMLYDFYKKSVSVASSSTASMHDVAALVDNHRDASSSLCSDLSTKCALL